MTENNNENNLIIIFWLGMKIVKIFIISLYIYIKKYLLPQSMLFTMHVCLLPLMWHINFKS